MNGVSVPRSQHTARRPSVRVVVVNWRQSDLTIRACRSLESQLREGDRLVVVDNASGDGSPQRLRAAGFDVIVTGANLGFGAGVNAGARGMTEDVLVLLNNDAVAQPGFIDAIAADLDGTDPLLGATTALMLLAGRWRRAAGNEPGLVGLTGERWTRLPDDQAAAGHGEVLVNSTGNMVDRSGNGYDRGWLTPLEDLRVDPNVFGICGGACAIRADVWRELGGFRENLFMYYEDTDLSWRLHEHGYNVQFVREAVVDHDHAASSGTQSPMFLKVNARNRLLVAADHAPFPVVARALARSVVRTIRTGPHSPQAQGFREALSHLPEAIRSRWNRPVTGTDAHM